MFDNQFNRQNFSKETNSLANIVATSFGLSSYGLGRDLISIISVFLQIISVPAKLLLRKRLGIRAMGRVRFFLFLAILWVYSEFRGGLVVSGLVKEVDSPINAQSFAIIAFLFFILWVDNYRSFWKREGFERISYFRGYGIFSWRKIGKYKTETKKLKRSRLLDPIVLFLSLLVLYLYPFNSANFLIEFGLCSCVVLLAEELIYLYGDRNFELDKADSKLRMELISQREQESIEY